MATHRLKTWPQYFDEVYACTKTFEIRKNDRDYKVGDELVLERYDPVNGYDKPVMEITKTVTYILHGGQFGLQEGYVAMAIQ